MYKVEFVRLYSLYICTSPDAARKRIASEVTRRALNGPALRKAAFYRVPKIGTRPQLGKRLNRGLFPCVGDELLQRPDASPELRRVCLYVLFGDDKLNIVGLHFFELLDRVSLLHRNEEMSAPPVSIRLAQDLTPTVLACRLGGKDYQLLGWEGEVVVGRTTREDEIGPLVSLRPDLLFELKFIRREN